MKFRFHLFCAAAVLAVTPTASFSQSVPPETEEGRLVCIINIDADGPFLDCAELPDPPGPTTA